MIVCTPSIRRYIVGTTLWAVIAVLVVLWLIGLVGKIGGALIHLLLVGALILLVLNLLH